MTMCDFDPLSSDEPLDLNSIRASDALISALARGDDDTVRALTVSDDALLEILRALAATGRPGARRRHVRRTEVDAHLDAAPAHHRRYPMTITEPTPQQVLDCPMDPNDSGADTIRGYLVKLLALVWCDGECFNGKRPFGNSSWSDDLYVPLVKAGYLTGSFDEDDYLAGCDARAGDDLIAQAIQALGRTAP